MANKPSGASAFSGIPKNPYMEGGDGTTPAASAGMSFKDVGSYGLRAYSGYLREEFLKALVGREAARTYREMGDNCATVGSILFAVTQMMRKVDWPVVPADASAESASAVEFVESVMDDMTTTWDEFVTEALSMLQYGYAPHEIVYKRRQGTKSDDSTSKYDDGKIGLKRLPLRGQDTVIKWFFDENGQVNGLRQQPWVGPLIDLPAEKFLLFRPSSHKNNPEGRSILRSAYRAYYFLKRMEEQEAILFERLSGFPVMSVPSSLLIAAQGGDAAAISAVEAYKKIVTNVRIDEQMGLLKPSDPWMDPDGKISAVEQYKFELVTPAAGGKANAGISTVIERYKTDILTSVLADFLLIGHSSKGAQNTAIQKVDMFFQAIEGWLNAIAGVLNRDLLPRLWKINDMDPKTMPTFAPNMAQRIDLDALGNFCLHLAQAGMQMFPDFDLENYIRDASGLPNITEEDWQDKQDQQQALMQAQQPIPDGAMGVQSDSQNAGTEGGAPNASEAPGGARSKNPNAGRAATIHQPNTNAAAAVNGRNQRGKAPAGKTDGSPAIKKSRPQTSRNRII